MAIYARANVNALFELEKKGNPAPNYMTRQIDINEKMRGILVDWVIEVHLKFKYFPETLYLAINLIDRYLERTQILRNRLQLVAVAALLIASKYEEIYANEVKDFVFISDNAYSREEVLSMEEQILISLEFNVTIASSYRFLERFAKVGQVSEKVFHLA